MVDANSGNVEGRLVSPSPVPLSTVSRRTFLRSSALGLGALALAGSRATSTPSSATDRSTPRHGGTLRAALSGGTSSDTLDAQAGVNFVDIARCWQLYDGLLTYTDDAGLELALAEEITPNHDATLWTIRVKPGITCHDGKPFGAEDVIYSLRRIMNPKSPLPGAASVGPIDYNGMRKVDARTCTISCHSPFSTFAQLLPTHYFTMVPVDYNPKKPIGTGPFRFKSFTPGVQSIFPRNDNYWQDPLPYADEVITSDYSDETSQINALLSGEADLIDLLSAVAISTVKSGGGDIVISHGGGITPFTMRVDQPPFNDVRVRQALRLLVDRPEMMDLIFEGHGILGNDITSIWDPVYDHSIPQRVRDVPQAKHLLKKAGFDHGLNVTLVTSAIAEGTVDAAEIFQQQAKAGGVNISLKEVTSTELYGPEYLKWTFAQDFWLFYYYFPMVGLGLLPSSPYNECHWDDPHYNALYNEGLKTVDAAKRADIAHEMQMIDYDSGGYIIAYFPGVIDGVAKNVKGVVPSKTGIPLTNFAFKSFWFD